MKRLVTVFLLILLLFIVLYLYSPSCEVFKETLPHCYPKTIEEKPIHLHSRLPHKSEIDVHWSRLTSPKERRPAGSSANASLGCTSFSAHKQRDSTNACDTFVSRDLDWTVKNTFVCEDKEHTCWRCAAGKTAADSLPGVEKAAGRCRRPAEVSALGPLWSCMAWSCSTGQHKTKSVFSNCSHWIEL